LDLALSQANQVDELKDGLVNAQQMNDEQLEANKIQLEEDATKTKKPRYAGPCSQTDKELVAAYTIWHASQTSLGTLTATTDSNSTSQTSPDDDIIGVSSGMEMEMANKKLMIQQLEEKKILLEEKIKEMETNEVEMQVFEFSFILTKKMG
jgi:hypothetical protein